MSWQEEVIREEVFGAFNSGLAKIIDSIERERLRRWAEPELWKRFHLRMVQTTPRWRWLARLHHRRKARQYEAMDFAQDGMALVAIKRVTGE